MGSGIVTNLPTHVRRMNGLLRRLTLFCTVPLVGSLNLFCLFFPFSVAVMGAIYVLLWVLGALVWLITGKPCYKLFTEPFTEFLDTHLMRAPAWNITTSYIKKVDEIFSSRAKTGAGQYISQEIDHR